MSESFFKKLERLQREAADISKTLGEGESLLNDLKTELLKHKEPNMKIAYTKNRLRADARRTCATAEEIMEEYKKRNQKLTVRQLYYQFVSRDLIPNTFRSYKNFSGIIANGRMAGILDWSMIEDRTRNLMSVPWWPNPKAAIDAAGRRYMEDVWDDQEWRMEVWIEKEALSGTIDEVCSSNLVPYFACKGYTSQSEMWEASQRIVGRMQQTVILHLGDHDPSGMDMTRDIEDRLRTFCEAHDTPAPLVERIALNGDQIRRYKPPPNPAKFTDSRAAVYVREHGKQSWELDALSPEIIETLIQERIEHYRDSGRWSKRLAAMEVNRARLKKAKVPK